MRPDEAATSKAQKRVSENPFGSDYYYSETEKERSVDPTAKKGMIESLKERKANAEKKTVTKQYLDWTTEDVSEWLEKTVKLKEYKENFKEMRISGGTLDFLNLSNLNRLGIRNRDHQQHIIEGVEKLKKGIHEEMVEPQN